MSISSANVAVPPPMGGAQDRPRANSNLQGRLRATSDLLSEGIITREEKNALNDLLVRSGPEFREQFDRARRDKDLGAVKRLLQEYSDSDINLSAMTLGDVEDFSFLDSMQLDATGAPLDFMTSAQGGQQQGLGLHGLQQQQQQQQPVLTAVPASGPSSSPAHMRHRQSVGFGDIHLTAAVDAAADFTRKRQASHTLAPQGMSKVVANSAGPAAASAADAPAVGGRRPSAPGDVHRAAAAAAAVPSPRASPGGPRGRGRVKAEPADAVRSPSSGLGGGLGGDDDDEEGGTGEAKSRKNERERKRRLAVTQGFDELFKMLRALEDQRVAQGGAPAVGADGKAVSAMATSKLDKASILRNTIDRIQAMETQVESLRKDNDRVQLLLHQHLAKAASGK